MDTDIENTQQLFVDLVIPEKGDPYARVYVLGNVEYLAKTYVMLCNGGNIIQAHRVEIRKMSWGNLPIQEMGHVRISIDLNYLIYGLSLTLFSVIKVSDSQQRGLKSRTVYIDQMFFDHG